MMTEFHFITRDSIFGTMFSTNLTLIEGAVLLNEERVDVRLIEMLFEIPGEPLQQLFMWVPLAYIRT